MKKYKRFLNIKEFFHSLSLAATISQQNIIKKNMWTPISFEELYDKIIMTEQRLMAENEGFWKLIRILPEKWQEEQYGAEGGGFWVVAICGRRVIWYNDIEEGFNISKYHKYGKVDEYWCNQSDLDDTITQLLACMKFGHDSIVQAGPPQNF